MSLVDQLIQEGWLKSPKIIEAFGAVKRKDFLPEDMKNLAEMNEALPIGHGQTISQPLVVAFMLELLEPRKGDRILDVGSGSGWTSALLAHIVSGGELNEKLNGKIITIDIVPELVEFGKKNVGKYNLIEKGIVEFICADGSKGYGKEAPFDKILCSAAVQNRVPQGWKDQLKIKGRIVTSIGSAIRLLVKNTDKDFEEIEYPGFSFVPLIEK